MTGKMQIEIEETVNQQAEKSRSASESNRCHQWIRRTNAARDSAKYDNNEPESNCRPDHASISENLQVIIVCCCSYSLHSVVSRVDRIGCLISTQSNPDQRIMANYRPGILPDFAATPVIRLRLAQVGIVLITGRDPVDNRLSANPDHPCPDRRQDDDNCRYTHHHSGIAGLSSSGRGLEMPETHHREKGQLGQDTDHPPAREGKYCRYTHKHCGYPIRQSFFSAGVARHDERDRECDEQFHITGEVVPVKKWAERSHPGLPQPVDTGAPAEMLHEPENPGHGAKDDQESGQRQQPASPRQKVSG